jgi:hypothetical protein
MAFLEGMSRRGERWLKYLIAIIIGNVIYFSLESHLPSAAQHHTFRPDLGTVVDLWFCMVVYGLLELVISQIRRKQGQ